MVKNKKDPLIQVSLDINTEIFDGRTPDEIISEINEVRHDAMLDGMIGSGKFILEIEEDPYADSRYIVIKFQYDRNETPEEKNQRLAEDERRKQAAKEERQRMNKLKKDPDFQEFQRLSNKFRGVL